MVFVAYFMKLVYLDTVNPDNPVLKLPKTKTLYDHIVGQYKVYVEENEPAYAYNHPGNLKDLYSHTWDYRWQYAVMTAINDFIISGVGGIQQRTIEKEWITYLEEVSEVYEYTDKHPPTSAAAVASANTGGRPSAGGNKSPNTPAKAGDTSTNAGGRPSAAAKTGAGNTIPATKPVVQPSAAAKTGAGNTIPATKPVVQPPAGANEGQTAAANADIPKLALSNVSPPPSEASEEEVKSDGEESDADGAGQDIGTAPGTPADTNFTPENTPPPNRKAENDRPKSAPIYRTLKEKESAEDLVSGRHRGFETARDKKRSEVYNKNRIQKPDGKDGPAAGADPADGGAADGGVEAGAKSTSKKRSSEESAESVETLDLPIKRHVKYRKQPTDLALAVIKENAAAEPVAGAVEPVARGGGRTILLPPSIKDKNPDGSTKFKISEQKRTLYKLAYRWKPYSKNIEALASRVRELMKLPPNELKKQIANMNDLISVICMYFHHCYHNPVYQKYLRDNFTDPALRYEFMVIELMSGAGNTTDKDGTDENLTFIAPEEWIQLLEEFGNTKTSKIEESQHESFSKKHHASIIELKKMYEEREKQRKQEASKRKMDTQGDTKEDTKVEDKRPRTGQTLEEFTRVLMFTEEEERDMLYVQNENWRKYSAQITKLTQYIKKFTDEPGTIFTREEYNVFLDNNPKTKLLIEYFQKYIQSNDVTDDQVMDVFHFASIQNESIIVDAINFVISYDDIVDEWEAFLRMTQEDLDTKDIKLAPGIGSKLNTFPADVSPLIYNLTRRLEALQDW
jgi:hypothetical protein